MKPREERLKEIWAQINKDRDFLLGVAQMFSADGSVHMKQRLLEVADGIVDVACERDAFWRKADELEEKIAQLKEEQVDAAAERRFNDWD